MTIPLANAAREPLTTDADIERRVRALLGSACRRRVWTLLLDVHDVQAPVLIPCANYPEPGRLPFATLLAGRLCTLANEVNAVSVVLVWERLGPELIAPAERF